MPMIERFDAATNKNARRLLERAINRLDDQRSDVWDADSDDWGYAASDLEILDAIDLMLDCYKRLQAEVPIPPTPAQLRAALHTLYHAKEHLVLSGAYSRTVDPSTFDAIDMLEHSRQQLQWQEAHQ